MFDWSKLIRVAIILVVAAALMWALRAVNRRFFHRLQKDKRDLHLSFLERLVNIVIIIGIIMLTVSALDGANSVWKTLLGGTAVVSAVLAFAAQDVIKDVLAGLMISLYKPFDIGDRIELSDGVTGYVEDITMRHVVIHGMDTLRHVVPNSVLNGMRVTNYSYHSPYRSILFRFSVGYDSDIELAKRLIAQAVEESEYTLPGRTDAEGVPCYSPVHFSSFADSALILSVTVYFTPGVVGTSIVKDDINTRVRAALNENGIEIPYNYVTVVMPEK